MGSGVLGLLHLERDHGFGWQRGGEAAFGCLEILELGWLDSVGLFEGDVLMNQQKQEAGRGSDFPIRRPLKT